VHKLWLLRLFAVNQDALSKMDFPIQEATGLLARHLHLIEHWASTFLTTSFDKIVEHVRPFIDDPQLQEEFYSLCNRCQYKRDISHSVTPLTLKPCNDGMSPKKRHEIEHLVPYLKDLTGRGNIHTIVDVGAGKCFSPLTFLKTFPNDETVKLVCLEDALSLCDGKWAPEKILGTVPTSQRDRMIIETTRINRDSKLNISTPYLMYSLHSCGELSNHMLAMFVRDPQARILCTIGCCYHFLGGFMVADNKQHWSNNHFALANIDETSISEDCLERLYRRALLEVLSPGVAQKSYDADFVQYCKTHRVDKTIEELQQFYQKHLDAKPILDLAWKMRCCLGPVMESIIVHDRVSYLVSNEITNVKVVAMWDQRISPRNLAIVAHKDLK
jgi:hypothetical protein